MDQKFPMEFTLDSGTHVLIRQTGSSRFEFNLTPTEGAPRQFTYVEGEHTKSEWDDVADFEQLEALRRFWLETEDIV